MFSCLQILEAFLWFVLITLLNVTLIILTLSVSRLLNLLLRLVAFLLFITTQLLAYIIRWITASSSWKIFYLFVCRALSSIMVICMLTAIRLLLTFFFFSSRRRHTRYIGDWSSDVCSSDLAAARPGVPACARPLAAVASSNRPCPLFRNSVRRPSSPTTTRSTCPSPSKSPKAEIGRASCRGRGGRGGVGAAVERQGVV